MGQPVSSRQVCPNPTSTDMWEKYRIASLFCLVYPAVAIRGMDLDVPRGTDLANVMLSRQARAAVDLDWLSLLP